MLYLILSACAVTITSVTLSYWVKKHRLLDKDIEAAITRKLGSSEYMTELATLREERTVMRNLLHDILENEASVTRITSQTSEQERMMLFSTRNQRRRELFGESLAVLGQFPTIEWRKNADVHQS